MALKIQVEEDKLVLAANDRILTLTAQQIYRAKYLGQPLLNHPSNELDWPSEIEFTRFPAQVRLAIRDMNADGPSLCVSLLVDARGQQPFFLGQLPDSDHVVVGNQWVPFGEVDYAAISELWKLAYAGGSSVLTLDKFVRLTAHSLAKRYLVNKCKNLASALPALVAEHSDWEPTGLGHGVSLYPYQKAGWRWLKSLCNMGLGAVLADEMGLGKTLQIIALLADAPPPKDHPALIVMPNTLISNWKRELDRFAPQLDYAIHLGPNRTSFYRGLLDHSLVLTTYDLVWSDLSLLEMVEWSMVILDEAHAIRNHETKRFRAISNIPRKTGIAITGTPIQNGLKDAWAIFDFVLPNYCGSLPEFLADYKDNESDALSLAPKLSPFMLRRTVKEVAQDLPELIMIPQPITMSEQEALAYEETRKAILASGSPSLATITPLRQMCCHPRLRDERWQNVDITQSTKFARLAELLFEIRCAREKVLVFTTYNAMAELIADYASRNLSVPAYVLNGGVPQEERQGLIDRFSSAAGSAVLVLNPQVGGVGLNIQAANHVIHFNLEWNPAVEDQSTARAYRRGQTLPVTVHRLFYEGTIEEVIDARVTLKRGLIDNAVEGVKGDDSDIALALTRSPLITLNA